MMAITTTLVFAAVLAYCGRVPPPTLGAPTPDVAAVAGEVTAPAGVDAVPASPVIDSPVIDAPVATTTEQAVGSPVAGPSQAAQVGVALPAAPGPISQPSRPNGASNGSGAPAPPASPTATDSGSAPDDGSAPVSSTAPATSTTTVDAAGPIAPGATAAADGPTPSTSTTAPATTSTTAKPTTIVQVATTTAPTTTSTAPTTTTPAPAATTTTTTTTTTTGPPADPGVALAIDFQRGTDAASVGLVAMSPGPHGATTDLAISGGVARAQQLGVEVYARTPDLGSPDHWVEADLTIGADITGNFTGVMTRVAESNTGYRWHKFETWGTWNGLRLLTLVDSRIDEEQYFPYQLRANTTYRLRLEARGTTLVGFVDGVELFRVTRTAGAGNRSAGINMTASGNASNTMIDNLAAGAF